MTPLACMAHARRYFEKALDHDQKRAEYALSVIQAAAIMHPERVSKAEAILERWKQ
ncbi:MAG: transposase [Bacteroidota bacterium]